METTPVTPAPRTVKVRNAKTTVSKSSSKAVAAIVTKTPTVKQATKPAKKADVKVKRKAVTKKSAASDLNANKLIATDASVIGTNVADANEQIAVAAYYLAEKRHFVPGHELDDWLAAEHQLHTLSK